MTQFGTMADPDAPVRVVEVYDEADRLEGYAVIKGGVLLPTIHAVRSQAHTARVEQEGAQA